MKASQHFQDPNNSAVAALKFCHSGQGSKILGMSPSELKSLSTALAKVTQGDSREIYKVLVNFIYRERRLSQTATDLGETSQRLTDVFYPEESKGSIESTIGGAEPGSPDETDGLTFYHSDTNSDVSPRGSKLETVLSSAPSPPLDSSSPKSTGSSIAVQTELLDNCVGEALSISSHAATTSKVSGSSSKAGVSTISTNTGQYRPIIHTQQPPEGSTDVALQTCASSTGIPTGITTGIQDDLTATSNQTGVAVVGIPGTVVMTSIQSSLAAMGGRTYVAPPPSMSNASSSIEFTSSPLLCDRLVAVQPTSKSGTTSGDLGVFHNRPVFENKALQPHPRSAFHAQGFFSSQTQGVGMGREAQGTDVIGMYHGEQGAQLNMGNDRGVGDMRPVGQRQDKVWNWRTERSLEIQMVIPPVLDFPGVLCVGTSAEALLPIHNPTSRWIRCSSTIISCSVNGLKVRMLVSCYHLQFISYLASFLLVIRKGILSIGRATKISESERGTSMLFFFPVSLTTFTNRQLYWHSLRI